MEKKGLKMNFKAEMHLAGVVDAKLMRGLARAHQALPSCQTCSRLCKY